MSNCIRFDENPPQNRLKSYIFNRSVLVIGARGGTTVRGGELAKCQAMTALKLPRGAARAPQSHGIG